MPRAIVVGGSLGGLFAGNMLLRAGCDVTIIERSIGELEGRGAGLGVHPSMLEGLLAAGARVDGAVGVAVAGRVALARDGSVAAELAMPQFCTSWARLYNMLNDAFPEERVRRGVELVEFEHDDDGVTARFADGETLRGDLLVGADGVRSAVRRQLYPDAELIYAGYIAWRGMVEERALSPSTHAALFNRFGWGLISGEHIVGYPVPGIGDDLTLGRRRYNIVWYRPVAAEPDLRDMLTDSSGRHHPDGIPPQSIRPEFIATMRRDAEALLAPQWGEMVMSCEQPLFQPIGDLVSPQMAVGRVALLGDAAFVARPHAARGAIKAGHDAIALAATFSPGRVTESLRRYDELRRAPNLAIVAESRRLGAYLEGKTWRLADPSAFMRENGSIPVTSPAREAKTMLSPPAISRRARSSPSRITYIFSAGSPSRRTTSPGCARITSARDKNHSMSSADKSANAFTFRSCSASSSRSAPTGLPTNGPSLTSSPRNSDTRTFDATL